MYRVLEAFSLNATLIFTLIIIIIYNNYGCVSKFQFFHIYEPLNAAQLTQLTDKEYELSIILVANTNIPFIDLLTFYTVSEPLCILSRGDLASVISKWYVLI